MINLIMIVIFYRSISQVTLFFFVSYIFSLFIGSILWSSKYHIYIRSSIIIEIIT
jgi:hypothetical protein